VLFLEVVPHYIVIHVILAFITLQEHARHVITLQLELRQTGALFAVALEHVLVVLLINQFKQVFVQLLLPSVAWREELPELAILNLLLLHQVFAILDISLSAPSALFAHPLALHALPLLQVARLV
jgi:hypothetical protein